VKIRGFRVELCEVETVLREHPRVRAAAVRLVEREGLQQLAACVVVDGPPERLDRGEVLSLLEGRLPP
jgi:acyl-coenzyme A synthetase/AMP-(fatty) acid ligase